MNFSRETEGKLAIFAQLLQKWSPKINLVSQSTLKEAGERHFMDSLQVASLLPPGSESWVDLGSGGGFPGAVVAIVQAEETPSLKVTLIEADQRKAVFLRTVSRETKTPFTVIAKRLQDVPPQACDVISARALAPLVDLCAHVDLHRKKDGTALLLKGERWKEEVAEAQKQWHFDFEVHKSETDPNAVILEIGALSRA